MREGRPSPMHVLVLLALLQHTHAISWLSIGLVNWEGTNSNACKDLRGLNKKQLRYCRRNPDIVRSIAGGTVSAYSECQHQFNKRRWNCTILDVREGKGRGIEEATREAAFVHAILSVGVAYGVTRDCSRGLSERCGCDHSPRNNKGGHTYEGCSDNIHYGLGVSREFVDAADRGGNAANILNLHNNRAGRDVLHANMHKQCKCHGMSGSCETTTCWMAVPPFRAIGDIMKEKFDGASEVLIKQDEKPTIVMKNNQLKRHTHADLVYSTPSPDYCERDVSRGILGTRGRECNHTSQGVDGCQLLCCNRGFERRDAVREEKCRCKFIYCCRVECDLCTFAHSTYHCL